MENSEGRIRRQRTEMEDTEMEEPERKIRRQITESQKPARKICRQITSLDDEEVFPRVARRGPLIVKELLKAIPNSRYLHWPRSTSLHEILLIAIENGRTSLVIGYTDDHRIDHVRIINLLNGAVANFRLTELTPREEIPNRGDPPPRQFPQVHMARFTSPASVGTSSPYTEEAVAGECAKVSKECGPRFTLQLISVEKVDFDTGKFRFVCKPLSCFENPA
ncbi:unnamed protein product [Cochlearia groenlandica]